MIRRRHLHLFSVCASLALLAWAVPSRAVRSADGETMAAAKKQALLHQSKPTAEYRRLEPWWPTKELESTSGYAGDAACAACHAEMVASQRRSQMARTLIPKPAALPTHAQAMRYENGGYRYALEQSAQELTVSVTDGKTARSAVAAWAFGSGDVGQSYLWQQGSGFQESRFNYFEGMHGLAATPGRLHGAPVSMDTALGRPLENFEARTCFGCHVTGMSTAPLAAASFVAGIHCEACHGPAREHIAAAHAAEATGTREWDRKVVNFADWKPAKAVDGCGSCHGTPWDVMLMGAVGRQTVRFPAYRLEQSRCWGAAGDARLTCTACHDPHSPLEKNDTAYDTACMACHARKLTAVGHEAASGTPVAKTCPVGTSKCVSCHMPKVMLPEMHYAFTDHRIRTVRTGEAIPD